MILLSTCFLTSSRTHSMSLLCLKRYCLDSYSITRYLTTQLLPFPFLVAPQHSFTRSFVHSFNYSTVFNLRTYQVDHAFIQSSRHQWLTRSCLSTISKHPNPIRQYRPSLFPINHRQRQILRWWQQGIRSRPQMRLRRRYRFFQRSIHP